MSLARRCGWSHSPYDASESRLSRPLRRQSREPRPSNTSGVTGDGLAEECQRPFSHPCGSDRQGTASVWPVDEKVATLSLCD